MNKRQDGSSQHVQIANRTIENWPSWKKEIISPTASTVFADSKVIRVAVSSMSSSIEKLK